MALTELLLSPRLLSRWVVFHPYTDAATARMMVKARYLNLFLFIICCKVKDFTAGKLHVPTVLTTDCKKTVCVFGMSHFLIESLSEGIANIHKYILFHGGARTIIF